MFQRTDSSFSPSAKPNQTGELLVGLGILAGGMIYSLAYPSQPKAEKPQNAVVAESDPVSEWMNLQAPRGLDTTDFRKQLELNSSHADVKNQD